MVNVHPVAADEHGNITDRKVLDRLRDVQGIGGDPLQWQTSRAFDVTQGPRIEDRPVIKFHAGEATTLTTPVEYKPSVLSIGKQTLGWDGQDDPVFDFFPGAYETKYGANQDHSLMGAMKPEGSTQNAGWPVVFAFATASPVVELGYYGVFQNSMILMVEVNGRLVDDTVFTGNGLQIGSNVTLTFPDTGRSRVIRIWGLHYPGLRAVRVPTGQTVTKPEGTGRVAAIIGDSFVNGSGYSNVYPDQGAQLIETFAPRFLRMLGYNKQVLAGIGGTGYLSSSPFSSRVPLVLSRNPELLVLYGSVNDGSNPVGLQAAVESVLASVASVPRVVVVSTGVPGYENHTAQLKAATETAGREFVDLGEFFTGTGNVTAPKSDGNRDFYRKTDNIHPTLDGHRAMARAVFERIAP